MSRNDLSHYEELFTGIGPVRIKAMFGGYGIYSGELFFALVAEGELYLKVDDETERDFADAGCAPFVYHGGQKPMTMRYWSVPAEALDSSEAMTPWARRALGAAARKLPGKQRAKARAKKKKG